MATSGGGSVAPNGETDSQQQSSSSSGGGCGGSSSSGSSKEAPSKVDIERSEEMKKVADNAFQEHHFIKAVDLYTEAIEANPSNAILWTNRSFAHSKLEEYSSALEDASKAIELDPTYVKGYYCRGAAHLAMGKCKDALRNFRKKDHSISLDIREGTIGPLAMWQHRIGLPILLLAFLFTILLLFGDLLPLASPSFSPSLLSPSKKEFCIVVDCGSTGTRLYVYRWSPTANGRLPAVEAASVGSGDTQWKGAQQRQQQKQKGTGKAFDRVETEPGLDKFYGDRKGLREKSLGPLFSWATAQIPEEFRRETPVFMLATAGLRKLPEERAEWVLEEARAFVRGLPFLFQDHWVRMISGVDEAIYGWASLNYVREQFKGVGDSDSTLGALDLGGSSLEVTFVPLKRVPSPSGIDVSLYDRSFHLFARCHSGFGMNDAFDRSVALLLKSSLGTVSAPLETGQRFSPRVAHPCLHFGYNTSHMLSHTKLLTSKEKSSLGLSPPAFGKEGARVQLEGRPDWSRCLELTREVLRSNDVQSLEGGGESCELPPCALGSHQPHHPGSFVAMSGFFVVSRFFSLPHNATLADILSKGRRFCSRPWADVERAFGHVRGFDRNCFRAPYAVLLLREGLGLSDRQVSIGTGEVSWTLGAALLEAPSAVERLRGGKEGNGETRGRPSEVAGEVPVWAEADVAEAAGLPQGAGFWGGSEERLLTIILFVFLGLFILLALLVRTCGGNVAGSSLGRRGMGPWTVGNWIASNWLPRKLVPELPLLWRNGEVNDHGKSEA